jgi:biopolymer transport protein ExbD
MAGDVVQREKKGKHKGLRRPKRRIGIRIDMTPMVDIAFLLLIFYMVSTVFAMPQAMEINLPPKDDKPEDDSTIVKESNLLTVRVDSEGRFWWNTKIESPTNLPQLIPSTDKKPDSVAYIVNSDSLRNLLRKLNQDNPKLNTLVLINRQANYEDLVNILDEIDLLERSWNAYTARELKVDVKDLPKDKKFSYRYATGKWEERDDKIMIDAQLAAQARGQL